MWAPPEVDWSDVAFDRAAAEAAANACDRLAGLVRDVLDDARRWQADARAGWEGGLAEEFDHVLAAWRRDLAGHADDLRREALALRHATGLAADEQVRREADREAWWDWARARDRVRAGG